MKLSVVIASSQKGWRGGEHQAALLARGLRDRDHECCIIARRSGMFATRMRSEGFEVLEIGRSWNPKAIVQQRQLLKQRQPDILHCNDSQALTGAGIANLGLPSACLASRRVAFQPKGRWKYCKLADRVLCTSKSIAECCTSIGIPDEHLSIVYDGVDVPVHNARAARTLRNELEITDKDFLLSVVAAHTAEKGLDILIKAVYLLRDRMPELKVVLAGDGPLRAQLEEQAEQLGVTRQLRFLGHRNDVPIVMQASDAFVLPSRFEGLGSSIIDAMLLERPIVASATGGIPELFEVKADAEPLAVQAGTSQTCHNAASQLVSPDSPEELAAGIERLYTQPAQALAQTTRRARVHALQKFSTDTMINTTLSAYLEVLGGEPQPKQKAA